jgi:ribosome-associated protein
MHMAALAATILSFAHTQTWRRNLDSKQIKEKIIEVLEDKKARDVVAIDVDGITVLADSFVLCSGTSSTHIKALADEVNKTLADELGVSCRHMEGYSSALWILLDYGDVVVHVFHEEARRFYDIERLWADGIVTHSSRSTGAGAAMRQ